MIQPMVDIDKERVARGKRFADVIKKSGKTQKEIALYVGVSPQSIHKWTNGGSIQAENLWVFADLVGEDAGYLMTGKVAAHPELRRLIGRLSVEQSKQVTLFTNMLINSEGANMGFSVDFSPKTP